MNFLKTSLKHGLHNLFVQKNNLPSNSICHELSEVPSSKNAISIDEAERP